MAETTDKVARSLSGRVISNRMDKSITVLIERQVKHPLYGKYVRKSTKLVAHDEQNECKEGDIVKIRESRPISRRKCWVLDQVVEKSSLSA